MKRRTSIVKNVKVYSVSTSSIIQFGDTKKIKPRSRAIAVQREFPFFLGNEGNFSNYLSFSLPIPEPLVQEKVELNIKNESPWIKVNQVTIVGVAGSSVFQVGSTKVVDAESRVKHIRQLLHGKMPKE